MWMSLVPATPEHSTLRMKAVSATLYSRFILKYPISPPSRTEHYSTHAHLGAPKLLVLDAATALGKAGRWAGGQSEHCRPGRMDGSGRADPPREGGRVRNGYPNRSCLRVHPNRQFRPDRCMRLALGGRRKQQTNSGFRLFKLRTKPCCLPLLPPAPRPPQRDVLTRAVKYKAA